MEKHPGLDEFSFTELIGYEIALGGLKSEYAQREIVNVEHEVNLRRNTLQHKLGRISLLTSQQQSILEPHCMVRILSMPGGSY